MKIIVLVKQVPDTAQLSILMDGLKPGPAVFDAIIYFKRKTAGL